MADCNITSNNKASNQNTITKKLIHNYSHCAPLGTYFSGIESRKKDLLLAIPL
jgi:hypothetical protein